jgi:signal transduction histidine kinase
VNRPEVIGMFKNFAQLIAFHLDAQERAARQEAALINAREAADLREQFVAILAHDLRNPPASIDAGVNLLLRRWPDEKMLRDVIRNSEVIGELRDVSENAIEAQITLHHPVNCDPKRIGQVASNLVANALKHGPDQHEQTFELAVANQGEPIDPVVMRQFFQPFFRGRSSNQGLGLGLYIASEIARAHGGKIEVASSEEETPVTLCIPRI